MLVTLLALLPQNEQTGELMFLMFVLLDIYDIEVYKKKINFK
jgi:hypothetical protein